MDCQNHRKSHFSLRDDDYIDNSNNYLVTAYYNAKHSFFSTFRSYLINSQNKPKVDIIIPIILIRKVVRI